MLPMKAEDATFKAVFHPASYTCTVDCSLSGVLAKLKVRRLLMQITRSRDCVCVLRNLEIGYACNLRILRMCNAILRLCKFSNCVEHFYSQTVRLPIGGAPYKHAKDRDGPFLIVSLNMKECPSLVDSNLMPSKQIIDKQWNYQRLQS